MGVLNEYPCICCTVDEVGKRNKHSKTDVHSCRSAFLLGDRLAKAAEYWSARGRLEQHWMYGWGVRRTARFIELVCGVKTVSGTVQSKHLIEAATSIYSNQGGDLNDLTFLAEFDNVLSNFHLKRLCRITLLKNPPQEILSQGVPGARATRLSFDVDTPRESTEKELQLLPEEKQSQLSLPIKYNALSESLGSTTAHDYSENGSHKLQFDGSRGMVFLAKVFSGSLSISLATPNFAELLASISNEHNLLQEEVRLRSQASALKSGKESLEVVIIPRFQDNIQSNPPLAKIVVDRELHMFTFEVSAPHSQITDEDEDINIRGSVEFWVGAILIGKLKIRVKHNELFTHERKVQNSYANEKEEDGVCINSGTWKFNSYPFRSVFLVGSYRDTELADSVKTYSNIVSEKLKTEIFTSALFAEDTDSLADSDNYESKYQSESDPDYDSDSDLISIKRREISRVAHTQVCWSDATLKCKISNLCIEFLVNNTSHKKRRPMDITIMYWQHPRPSIDQLEIIGAKSIFKEFIFYNSWMSRTGARNIKGGASNKFKTNSKSALDPGMAVLARKSSSDKWAQGRILNSKGSSSEAYDILLDNGAILTCIKLANIQVLAGPDSLITESTSGRQEKGKNTNLRYSMNQLPKRGELVYARYMKGKQYRCGFVAHVNKSNFTVDIAYDNGDAESNVDIGMIKGYHDSVKSFANVERQRLRAGNGTFGHCARVLMIAPSKDGRKYEGRIKRVNDHGLTYDLLLRNGECIERVPREFLIPENDSGESKTSATSSSSRTYVDAMTDRLKELIKRSASASPDGKELRIQFNRMDLDGNGKVSLYDFFQMIKQLGFQATDTEVCELFDRIDANKDGIVDYNEFVRFALPYGLIKAEACLPHGMKYYRSFLSSIELETKMGAILQGSLGKIWEIFLELDTLKVGVLSRKLFSQGLARLGLHFTREELETIIRCFELEEENVDYRACAAVFEHLHFQHYVSQSNEDEKRSRKGDLGRQQENLNGLSMKQKRLVKEHEAASKIQSIQRSRVARGKVSILSASKKHSLSSSEKYRRSKYTGSGNAEGTWWTLPKSDEESGESDIDRWRKILFKNTRQGADISRAFRVLDTNCDGELSYSELKNGLFKSGFDTSVNVKPIFKSMDRNEDGKIDFDDFINFINGTRRIQLLPDLSSNSRKSSIRSINQILGQSLVGRMRRYYYILEQTGTDLLKTLERAPSNAHAIKSALQKLGFQMTEGEWIKLVEYFHHSIEQHGHSTTCEDFAKFLKYGATLLLQKISPIQSTEDKQKFRGENTISKRSSEMDSSSKVQLKLGVEVVDKIRFKVERSLNVLPSQDAYPIIWWIVHMADTSDVKKRKRLSIDRLDMEMMFEKLNVTFSQHILDRLAESLDLRSNNRINCEELMHICGYASIPKIPSQIKTKWSRRRIKENALTLSEMQKARHRGIIGINEYLEEHLGKKSLAVLMSRFMACCYRGCKIDTGEWLLERYGSDGDIVSGSFFRSMLSELGVNLTSRDLNLLIKVLDPEDTNKVDLFEFSDIVSVIIRMNKKTPKNGNYDPLRNPIDSLRDSLRTVIKKSGVHNFRKLFDSLDIVKDGFIDASELQVILNRLRIDTGNITPSQLMSAFDKNGDGKLSYEDFLGVLGISNTQSNNVSASTKNILPKNKVSKLRALSKELWLTEEAIQDAIGQVKRKVQGSKLSRNDIYSILSILGLTKALTEADLGKLQQLSGLQMKAFLQSLL